MKEIRLIVKCVRYQDHRKILRFRSELGLYYVESLAGLLDGTSPYYIHKPAEGSPIGKCGICSAPLKCEIEERELPDAIDQRQPHNPGPAALEAQIDRTDPGHAGTDSESAAHSRPPAAEHGNDQFPAQCGDDGGRNHAPVLRSERAAHAQVDHPGKLARRIR